MEQASNNDVLNKMAMERIFILKIRKKTTEITWTYIEEEGHIWHIQGRRDRGKQRAMYLTSFCEWIVEKNGEP